MDGQFAFKLCKFSEVLAEIKRGNEKHGEGPLATPMQVVAILVEEIGEYAQAVLKGNDIDAEKELVQVCAVAFNHLLKTGPYYSQK